jgi:plasmid stabilization system protein ParE
MKVEFLDPAEGELAEAIQHYNRERPGLGDEFARELKRTTSRIASHPLAWVSVSHRTRRCRTNRFPYGVLYQIRENRILVVAVMHLHRDPDSWRDRIGNGDS